MSSFSFLLFFITLILSDYCIQFHTFSLAKIQHNRPFVKRFAKYFFSLYIKLL